MLKLSRTIKMMLRQISFGILLFFTLMLSSCNKPDNDYQGYIEGRYIYLSSSESGVLQSLMISRGQQVTKGQSAFILDPQPQAAALSEAQEKMQQAETTIAQAKANLALNQLTLHREKTLLKTQATQQSQVDIAQRDVDVAQAQLTAAQANYNAAKASYEQAQWSHAQKVITIPANAIVFDTYYLPGEFVPAQRPVASLLPPQEIRAIFFVPESILSQIQLNQAIQIHCDNCQSIKATISYISPSAEYTPPVIYSDSRRQHLTYRIEADLPENDAANFHPGQPIDVEIVNAIRH